MLADEFNDLFIFDIANNHQGQVDHGLNIIEQFAKVASLAKVRAAVKFQMRHLPTFIFEGSNASSNHLISRFESTSLSIENFKILKQFAESQGLLTACTPFDEISVQNVADLDFDYVKIASCSANDWPLINEITRLNKPIVASTGGLELHEIDSLVEYLKLKRKKFAIMHCVSMYPTPDDKLVLNQIRILKDRYKNIEIGWSTHENPDQIDAIKIAYALGARVFERHIGLAENGHKLNSYSSTPQQAALWLNAHKSARAMCGGYLTGKRDEQELKELQKLRRGVFSNQVIDQDCLLTNVSTRFAFPISEGQLLASEWTDYLVAQTKIEKNSPILKTQIQQSIDHNLSTARIVKRTFEILEKAQFATVANSSIELSHHFGIENFHRFGAVIFSCVNRGYCRKVIVLDAGQEHPTHYHKIKDETFFLVWGDLDIELNGVRKSLKPGDQILIEPQVWHRFWSTNGAVIDEISTTYIDGDSIYQDQRITDKKREDRKTFFQI